jgi:hypothetical protein
MIKAPDGGFVYTCNGWGTISPSTFSNAFMFVLKTDSCGFTEGDTCRIRYKVDQLVFNNLKMSIIPSISNYCHATWKVGDSIYTGASIQHTFTKKGLYEIKVSGFAGDSRDSSSIFISVDSIWKQDTTKLNIQTYKILHEMNIYPNPVVNTLEIDWKIPANNSNIEIFNTQGQLMKSILVEDSETNKTINVTDFPIGVYQVIFNMNGKIKSKSRFVK